MFSILSTFEKIYLFATSSYFRGSLVWENVAYFYSLISLLITKYVILFYLMFDRFV